MLTRFAALLVCNLALFAQDKAVTPEQPPPEVDAALRARIRIFYQAHVDGKFRVADQVVAEDSKDAFFAAPKQKYGGFEILRINYSDHFTKADAVVMCAGEWVVRGQRMKVNMALPSKWKLENGEWFWYVVPVTEVQTPFGVMHAPPDDKAGAPTPAIAIPPDPMVAAQAILQSVKADKKELMLSSYAKAEGEVKITNGMQGSISLRAEIDGRFPGLNFALDKTVLKAGEVATLKITCDPKDRVPKPTLTARVFVDPTGQVLPVTLYFAVPPEIEKQIPKDIRPKPEP
jgi:hypothetical protein